MVLGLGCGLPLGRAADTIADGTPVSAAAVQPAATTSDYRILPADILQIDVFQEPDLKSTLRVSNVGTIAFPLIGVVPVGGLSPQQAAQAICNRLAQGYLVKPQVSVTVMEFSKRRFTVLGEVQKPGAYDMPDQQQITVLQAIGMAGGYTRIANPSRVTLMRRIAGQEQTYSLNAKKMARGSSESGFTVKPGDVITVAESRF
ncbi:MAG TPA: polysaccharide biosynthesis/export family protein [Opitutaceae bacterium]|nr:polysaccharide biosynthesis/export family protein [Opitutaceae bacterium]